MWKSPKSRVKHCNPMKQTQQQHHYSAELRHHGSLSSTTNITSYTLNPQHSANPNLPTIPPPPLTLQQPRPSLRPTGIQTNRRLHRITNNPQRLPRIPVIRLAAHNRICPFPYVSPQHPHRRHRLDLHVRERQEALAQRDQDDWKFEFQQIGRGGRRGKFEVPFASAADKPRV